MCYLLGNISINIRKRPAEEKNMSNKVLLQTYIKQGKEYRKILEKANGHGKHTSKIKDIDLRLKQAAQRLKRI
jgi:hypothetical protein